MARSVKIPGPLYERARDEAEYRDISIGAVIDEWCRQAVDIDTGSSSDSDSDSDSKSDTLMTDGGYASHSHHLNELSAFQRDILYILGRHGPQYGLAIKRRLQTLYGYGPGEEVNHGRLYPNLDELVNAGHVNKSELDKRTNEYELTDSGIQFVRETAQRWLGAAEGRDGGETTRGVAKHRGGD